MALYKCIVRGCSNREGQGTFVGQLCTPCYQMLSEGKINSPGETFIHQLVDGQCLVLNALLQLFNELEASAAKFEGVVGAHRELLKSKRASKKEREP